jgi:hypothetical protein
VLHVPRRGACGGPIMRPMLVRVPLHPEMRLQSAPPRTRRPLRSFHHAPVSPRSSMSRTHEVERFVVDEYAAMRSASCMLATHASVRAIVGGSSSTRRRSPRSSKATMRWSRLACRATFPRPPNGSAWPGVAVALDPSSELRRRGAVGRDRVRPATLAERAPADTARSHVWRT